MRLAVFTPLDPVRSGISAYSAELLPRLARTHEVDIFVEDEVWRAWTRRATGRDPIGTRWAPVPARFDPERLNTGHFEQSEPSEPGQDGNERTGRGESDPAGSILRAHDFLPRHASHPYDLVIYQLGNATCHDYMWPYLVRHAGLVILHDGQLHHARARALLRQGREADYRAEFAYCHPDVDPRVADAVVYGAQGGLYYHWPLIDVPLRTARLVAVHNPRLADDLRERHPAIPIDTIRMGVGDPLPAGAGETPVAHDAVTHDGATRPVTFAAFGLITHEKRVPHILRALKTVPGAHVRLVGQTAAHYDVMADAKAAGVADRVTIVGYVSDEALTREMLACDVCLCLRWPTSHETSASWLRCLAAGKPTIVNDLKHLVDVPTLDPRTWTVLQARTDAAAATRPTPPNDAVAVSIDVLDEDHSLRLAMRRLANDAPRRVQLGRAARAWWQAHHTLDAMAADYERVIADAVRRPAPDPASLGLPPHLTADHTDLARRLLDEMGVAPGLFAPHT